MTDGWLAPKTGLSLDRKVPADDTGRENLARMLKHFKYHLLVVDDDQQILELTRQLLTESGYSVLTSTDPIEAHAMLENLELRIDLLLTDVEMPYMSGPALARKGVGLRRSLHVLFMSGDPTGSLYFRQEDKLLRKPFTMDELLCEVGQVLASQNGIARETETLPMTREGVERRKTNQTA